MNIHSFIWQLFEITAFEPKESFRATIKVFAPDIKFYRGGQASNSMFQRVDEAAADIYRLLPHVISLENRLR